MILSLEKAQTHNPDVTQDELDGLEIAIRELTNNPFQNQRIRFTEIRFTSKNTVEVLGDADLLQEDDTIQVSRSKVNNGLYVIESVVGNVITLKEANFFAGCESNAYITKVEYPADIKAGVAKLLKYDAKMQDKIGLKSKSVSRMSETYFDQTAGETVNGYPAAMMAFINKYRLLRW